MKVPNRSLVPIRGRLGTFSVAPASRAPTSDGQFERAAFDSVKCVASGLRDSWSSDRGRPDSQWTADGGSTVGPSRLLGLVGCRGGQDRVARSGSNGRSYGSASTGDQSAQCGGHTGDVTGCSYFRNRRTPAPGLCDRCHRCRPTRLVVARSWCGRVAPGAHSLDGLARNVPVPGCIAAVTGRLFAVGRSRHRTGLPLSKLTIRRASLIAASQEEFRLMRQAIVRWMARYIVIRAWNNYTETTTSIYSAPRERPANQ